MLQLEVAGTVIQLENDEAVLVLYADCKHKGRIIKMTGYGVRDQTAAIVERLVGDHTVCTAIFPRIKISYVEHPDISASPPHDFLPRLKENVSLSAGNVTEAYLSDA